MRILSCQIKGATCATGGKIGLDLVERNMKSNVTACNRRYREQNKIIIKNGSEGDAMIGKLYVNPSLDGATERCVGKGVLDIIGIFGHRKASKEKEL